MVRIEDEVQGTCRRPRDLGGVDRDSGPGQQAELPRLLQPLLVDPAEYGHLCGSCLRRLLVRQQTEVMKRRLRQGI